MLRFEDDGSFLFSLDRLEGEFAAKLADAVNPHRLSFLSFKDEDIGSAR